MKARGWNSERSFLTGWLHPTIQTRRAVEAQFPDADPIAFLNGVDNRVALDCYRLNLLLKQRDLPAVTPLTADRWADRVLVEYGVSPAENLARLLLAVTEDQEPLAAIVERVRRECGRAIDQAREVVR